MEIGFVCCVIPFHFLWNDDFNILGCELNVCSEVRGERASEPIVLTELMMG